MIRASTEQLGSTTTTMLARRLRLPMDFQVELPDKWRIVAWVGATSALQPSSASAQGEFDLSAQRLHLSAQRQLAKLRRETPRERVRAEAEMPDVARSADASALEDLTCRLGEESAGANARRLFAGTWMIR